MHKKGKERTLCCVTTVTTVNRVIEANKAMEHITSTYISHITSTKNLEKVGTSVKVFKDKYILLKVGN